MNLPNCDQHQQPQPVGGHSDEAGLDHDPGGTTPRQSVNAGQNHPGEGRALGGAPDRLHLACNRPAVPAWLAIVRGIAMFAGGAAFFKGFVVIRSPQELDVVGVYTVKNVISSAPNPPNPPGNRCPAIN